LRVILLMVVFGAAGTLARYGLEGWIQHRAGAGFPVGTLTVNLSGCLLLGLLGQYAFNHIAFSPELRSAITIGFFGAFTTFSTFSWETMHMLKDGDWKHAVGYIAFSVLGGLLAMLAGMRLGDAL
jgi:fluoride exporter